MKLTKLTNMSLEGKQSTSLAGIQRYVVALFTARIFEFFIEHLF